MNTRKPWFVLVRHDEGPDQITVEQPEQVVVDTGKAPASVTDTGAKPEGVKPDNGKGFPEGVALTEMTVEQREAYWKDKARLHETRLKGLVTGGELTELRAAAKELADLKESQKSDSEKAISEAEKRGRAEAVSDYAERLAKAEFRAAAAGKIPNADELVDDLNLAKFVTNGEVDSAAIAAAVERLAKAVPPVPKPPAADLMQGARPGGPPDFRTASKEELDAELAKHGARRRS